MSLFQLVDEEWDRVFAHAERGRGIPEHARAAWLRRLELTEPMRRVLELQLELGPPPSDPDPHRRGERIGRSIVLQRRIARGGSGDVYLGVNDTGGCMTPVAVKLLRVPRTGAAAVIESWRREAEWTRALSGTGYVPGFVAAGRHRSRGGERLLFLCTRLAQGMTLRRWCVMHRRSTIDALRLFLRICDAVSSIHAHGVIHGDLKPENLQVQSRGLRPHVWVLDLGLATVPGVDWHADAEQPVGTPGYMSPEQITRGRGPVREASDVYALGVILFELLQGERWLDVRGAPERRALWHRVARRANDGLSNVRCASLRAALEPIWRSAVAVDPRVRTPQVWQLRQALAQLID